MPAAMSRFLRILLNAATALSLVLCVATVVLWVRSHVRPALTYDYAWRGERWQAVAEEGVIRLHNGPQRAWEDARRPAGDAARMKENEALIAEYFLAESRWVDAGRPQGALKEALVLAEKRLNGHASAAWPPPGTGPAARSVWVAPFILAAAAMPAGWYARARAAEARESHRRRFRLCVACGYGLRATPRGGRCPECGRAVDRA
jgi:hypothetical protein